MHERWQWTEPNRIQENNRIITFYEQRGTLADKLTQSIWDIDRYVLHSHPDLTEWMLDAAKGTAAVRVALFGFAALAHPNGIIFATAYGMNVIGLRLPAVLRSGPSEEGVDVQLPEAWVGVKAWVNWLGTTADKDRMAAWINQAYDSAATASDAMVR